MIWSLFGSRAARRQRRARDAELTGFRTALDAAASSGSIADLDANLARLEARALELGLSEDDAPLEVEMLDGLRELAGFTKFVERHGFPVVETQHRVLTGERCRFSAPATRLGGAENAPGRLFLTDGRAVFLGPSVSAISWLSIAGVDRGGRDLVFATPAQRHQFCMNTFADALKAAWLSDRLSARIRRQS
ncbi:MAG TPA: hypothetical protein VHJ77_15630 [Vicinamibacterales bacterium]|jgi:hypothetical protein|nr:hypothetical protein [Vicinamibacterales bacterium]